MNNYYIENNKQFNLTGLPEKIRKYYRYDVNCAIQSAWIEYYRVQSIPKRTKN